MSWYDDSRFPFHVPVPPNWQAGAFVWTPGKVADCEYHVDLVPPGSRSGPGPDAALFDPLLMSIVVEVKCPPWRGTLDDQYFIAEPHLITISGVQATLYDNDSARNGIQHTAVARFGGHQYLFNLQYEFNAQAPPPSKAQQDQELAVYMQMLRGFRYTGT